MAAEFENRLIIKKIRNHPEKAAVMIYAVTDSGITPEMITRVAWCIVKYVEQLPKYEIKEERR